MPLIQDGVARAVVHDLHSGALAGVASTGHALTPGGAPDGPRPRNMVLAGGGAAALEELCAPIERGIYVTRFWYENVLRPKETLITAVTRDGTFLIEDGKVTRPVRDLRLTDSILGILSRVEDLTAAQELTSSAEFYDRRFAYGVVSPALRAGAVRFTDTTG
jgi:predicted Zn-dependent protease